VARAPTWVSHGTNGTKFVKMTTKFPKNEKSEICHIFSLTFPIAVARNPEWLMETWWGEKF
jgi:hypothetical protein